MLETEREEQMAAYFVTKKRLIGESRVWFRSAFFSVFSLCLVSY
jgi:hypothetical protein